MEIKQIAEELNKRASTYSIGGLQDIRKEIKKLSRKASSTIFTNETISEEGWAFHYGGRKELQFNIGFEEEGFRYGVAFSLETSQALPSIEVLFPKILKLNSLIVSQPEKFYSYKMWYWQDGQRSEITNVLEITEKIIKKGTFIFIGSLMDAQNINFDTVLDSFDDLLKVYIEVENENENYIIETATETSKVKGFWFQSGKKDLPQSTNYTSTQKQINVYARHSLLQEKLYNQLVSLFGEESVGLENYINGNRIDLVLNINSKYTFYEIKTGNSAKQCIREAIGQILEYTYYDGEKYADKIVIAGEYEIDLKTKQYLNFLKIEFNLPIEYYKINI